MIQANELRIGNYVSYGTFNGSDFSKVKGIYNEFDILLDMCRVFTKDIEPIPITEEILLKCGFELCTFRGDNEDYTITFDFDDGNEELEGLKPYTNNGFGIGYKENENCYYLYIHHTNADCSHGIRSHYRKINHLHQLQNLYFALTNEELTIKL